ncbi:MAG: hypothetical protein AB7F88_01705 [Pyrinomonadaceae bacterium]
MTPVLHPLVHVDILEAMQFYEREGGRELAVDFFYEYERTLQRILERPLSFPSSDPVLRRAIFERFPFHILFSVEPTHIFILVVRHERRHPDFGLDR